MEYVKLESGWLEKQIQATKEEVATWPEHWLEEFGFPESRKNDETKTPEGR